MNTERNDPFAGIDTPGFFESLPLPAFLLNGAGNIIKANSAARRLTGAGGSGGAKRFEELFDAECRDRLAESLSRTRNEGSADVDEIPLALGGEARFLRIFSGVVDEENHLLAIAVPADGRREFRDELLRYQSENSVERRKRSDLLTQLGHELGSSVDGIRQIAGLLKSSLADSPQATAAGYLNTILRGIDELNRLADDFRNYASLDRRHPAPEKLIFSLPVLIDDLRDRFAPVATRKGLEYHQLVQLREPGLFVGDPRRIRQVISSLIGYAIGITGTGRIDVIVGEEPLTSYLSDVTIEVRDTGPGIDPGLQQSFWSGTDGDGPEYDAGLPIARSIASSMKGQLYFETAGDAGTRYFFTLPLSRSDEARAASPQLEAPRLRKLRILLAMREDGEASRLAGELGKDGHIVVSTGNRDDLRSSMEFGNFDAMIIDIDDEALMGAEMIRMVRRGDAGGIEKDMAIIALTADTEMSAPEDPLPLPCDELLERTADGDTLLYLLSSILS
jgi:signal transduction histidine kinase